MIAPTKMKLQICLLLVAILGLTCASENLEKPDKFDKGIKVAKDGYRKIGHNESLNSVRDSELEKLKILLKQAANSTSGNGTVSATRQGPCQCAGGVCGCCSRILYNTWKQKACVNVTYDADEFSFTANVMMNNRVLYTRTVSGKNPRPICVPMPRVPYVRACVRFYNIYFQGRNMHMCVSMEGKFRDTTLFKVGLDCLRFGSNGLALVKPEDGGGLGQVEILPDPPAGSDDYGDEYDEDEDDDDDDIDDDDDDDDDEDLLDY